MKKTHWVAMLIIAPTFALTTQAVAHADPNPIPGCGYYVNTAPWSPCNPTNPPVPGVGGWSPIDGIPGQWGPHGYTPVMDH